MLTIRSHDLSLYVFLPGLPPVHPKKLMKMTSASRHHHTTVGLPPPSMSVFEIYYGCTTTYDDDFLEQCRRDPCVVARTNGTQYDIYLVVTEQEVRAGRTGLPHFLDTERGSSTMTVLTNPGEPSAPWKRAYWLPKSLQQDILAHLDAENKKS